MKTFLLILFVAIVGIFIFILITKPALLGIKNSLPVTGTAYNAFLTTCTHSPYNNTVSSCNQAWSAAQTLGISTYAAWAKYQCDQGHC